MMKKGVWARNLAALFLQGKLSIQDTFSFGLARWRSKPIHLNLQGIKFTEVDHILWSAIADIFINQVYTPGGMEIHANDVVVDIGAHRGGFTSFAAKRTSNTVFAFEPSQENYYHLQKLVRDNHFSNVRTRNAAVGSFTGKAHLHLSSSSSRHWLTPATANGNLTDVIAEVDVLSLDDCLTGLQVVDFLKLDCEGAEYDILLQASDKTLSKIQRIAAEIHDPPQSSKVQHLCRRIETFFPILTLVDQQKDGLGYLYASKPIG